MTVCKAYQLCLEEELSRFDQGKQQLLRAWMGYYHAVRSLVELYGIPESYMC